MRARGPSERLRRSAPADEQAEPDGHEEAGATASVAQLLAGELEEDVVERHRGDTRADDAVPQRGQRAVDRGSTCCARGVKMRTSLPDRLDLLDALDASSGATVSGGASRRSSMTSVACDSASSSGSVPQATTRPSSMIAMRSQRSSASSR